MMTTNGTCTIKLHTTVFSIKEMEHVIERVYRNYPPVAEFFRTYCKESHNIKDIESVYTILLDNDILDRGNKSKIDFMVIYVTLFEYVTEITNKAKNLLYEIWDYANI